MSCQHTRGLTPDGMCASGCGALVAPSLAGKALQIPTGTTYTDNSNGVKRVFTVSDTPQPMASNYEEAKTRAFETGATRSADKDKPDYEGFLHPLVLKRFGVYMHKHRLQPDGTYRDSDNWQLGIPKASCIKSGWRHFMDWWSEHRGIATVEGIEDAICAVIFNASAYLLNVLKERGYK